jgi:hypothetical protein
MLRHHTSTQQPCAAASTLIRRWRASANLLDVRGVKTTGGSGRSLDRASAPLVVNQTKRAIIAVMRQLGRPVTSAELQKIWAEPKSLELFEYHLSTLVKAEVVEVVYGSRLSFCIVRGA